MPERPVPTMCVGVGAPPYCFVLAVRFYGRFNISLRFMAHLLRKYVIAPTVRNKKICRGDSRIARDDVRSIFRLQHMFALTKSLPPRGRGTAAGFPETSLSSFGGSCVSGGRSLRDIKNLSILFFSHSPSVAPRQLPPGGSL